MNGVERRIDTSLDEELIVIGRLKLLWPWRSVKSPFVGLPISNLSGIFCCGAREDEIRSVEGPRCYARNRFVDATRGGPEGTAPDSTLSFSRQPHVAGK
jgi:hypothetical protein